MSNVRVDKCGIAELGGEPLNGSGFENDDSEAAFDEAPQVDQEAAK